MVFRYFPAATILLISFLSLVKTHVHLIGDLLHGSGMTNIPQGAYGSVRVLNLINNNISEIEPHVFLDDGFQNLEKALLRDNNILYIHPNAFLAQSKLLQLDLYGNSLTTIQKNTFAGLGALQHLHLGHNAIISIHKDVLEPLKSLETLDLSDNSLTELDEHLLTKTRVIELNLKGNALTLATNGSILESSSLRRLYMQSCNLTQLPPAAFYELPNLETLDLSNNKLKNLPNGLLGKLSFLHYLDISFNLIFQLSTSVFYLPTNLDVIFCDGNPLERILDCSKLLVTLQNHTIDVDFEVDNYEVLTTTDRIVLGTSDFQEEMGRQNSINVSADEDQDYGTTIRSHHPRHNIYYDTTGFEDAMERYSTIKSTDKSLEDTENVLIYSIVGVSALCLILVVVLLVEVLYLMRLYNRNKEEPLLDI